MAAATMSPTDVVYLIGNADNRLVKIGTTGRGNLERLRGIQTMSPSILTVLWKIPGGSELEHKLHYKFRAERRHGEWFDFGERDPIAEVSAAAAEFVRVVPAETPAAGDADESPITLIEAMGSAADHLGTLFVNDVVEVYASSEVAGCLSGLWALMISLRISIGMIGASIDESAATWGAGPATAGEAWSKIENARAGLDAAQVAFESASILLGAIEERLWQPPGPT